MTGSQARGLVVLAGAVLVGGTLVSPLLPPSLIPVATVVWYVALAVLLRAAYRVLSSWTAPRGALTLVGLAIVLPLALTVIRPGPGLALLLPCPRNFAWLPAWELRSSPLASLRFAVGGARVKLCYGRPAARGRRMLGGSRVPYGRLWRTGANEPTTLITTDSLEVAGIVVPPGRTSLYSIPGPESWELILNAATSQWGIESEYRAAVRLRERGRVILPSTRGVFAERMRFLVEPHGGDSAGSDLVLVWETTRVRIPLHGLSR